MEKSKNYRLPIQGGIRECSVFIMKVSSMEGNIPCGSFKNCYTKEDIPFYGLEDFFLKADRFCDEIGGPMSSVQCRSLYPLSRSGGKKSEMTLYSEKNKYHSVDQLVAEPFAKVSFLIWLLYRNNASWQGELYIKPPGGIGFRDKIAFRSVLELMKLIVEKLGSE